MSGANGHSSNVGAVTVFEFIPIPVDRTVSLRMRSAVECWVCNGDILILIVGGRVNEDNANSGTTLRFGSSSFFVGVSIDEILATITLRRLGCGTGTTTGEGLGTTLRVQSVISRS